MEDDIEILIAEDDEGHFILTKKFLREQGVQNHVRWFRDGVETLDFLYNPDGSCKEINPKKYLLLLDVRMPGIDGIQVLNKIRRDEYFNSLAVIILTSSPDPDQIEQAYDVGANGYIIKPIKYSSYIEAVHKVGLFADAVDDGVVLRFINSSSQSK